MSAPRRPGRWATLMVWLLVSMFAPAHAVASTSTLIAALPDGLTWLAAGDSYSSGHGTPGETSDCRQNSAAWPLVARSAQNQPVPDSQFRFKACSGNVMSDLFTQAEGRTYDLVTFSFGGNDVRFADILSECVTGGPVGVVNPWLKPISGCRSDETARSMIKAGITDRYRDFLRKAASEVANKGGNVVVVGYPALVEDPDHWVGTAQAIDLCNGIRRDDAMRIRAWAGELNAQIGAAVDDVNREHPNDVSLRFVNIQDGAGTDQTSADLYEPVGADARHNLCGTEPWLNGFHPKKGYHPTLTGHAHTGALVASTITSLDWSKLAPKGYAHRVTGDDVRTRQRADVGSEEGPDRLRRDDTVTVVCQEYGGYIPVQGDQDLLADTALWNKLDSGLYVADLYLDTAKPPSADPQNEHPGRDLSIPICAGTSPTRPPPPAPSSFATSLRSAWVPSLCEHPAGQLVNGELPGVPENMGGVTLQQNSLVTGDLTGDGVDDAAVIVNCYRGGIGWPPSVQLYGPGPAHLASIELDTLDKYATGRPYIENVDIADGHVTIDFVTAHPGENDLWPTRHATARLHLDRGDVVVDKVTYRG